MKKKKRKVGNIKLLLHAKVKSGNYQSQHLIQKALAHIFYWNFLHKLKNKCLQLPNLICQAQ